MLNAVEFLAIAFGFLRFAFGKPSVYCMNFIYSIRRIIIRRFPHRMFHTPDTVTAIIPRFFPGTCACRKSHGNAETLPLTGVKSGVPGGFRGIPGSGRAHDHGYESTITNVDRGRLTIVFRW